MFFPFSQSLTTLLSIFLGIWITVHSWYLHAIPSQDKNFTAEFYILLWNFYHIDYQTETPDTGVESFPNGKILVIWGKDKAYRSYAVNANRSTAVNLWIVFRSVFFSHRINSFLWVGQCSVAKKMARECFWGEFFHNYFVSHGKK